MRYQPDRDSHWRAWLVKTAEREVWRLARIGRNAEYVTTDEVGRIAYAMADSHDHIGNRERLREALHALSSLDERRRTTKALQISGYSYEQIGEILGMSYTRVNRQIAEANQVIREEQARLEADPLKRSARSGSTPHEARPRLVHGGRAPRRSHGRFGCRTLVPR